ncbi:hypothetical protein M3P36_05140 [Altererythrobacter sp. KTW20L]|uniref:hypothetical protein n=1 Tax=Altererythrobacter sp. KTW20L TaxID=2942210 RepID=UPI0020BF5264|nr:hypothetical protein [Altererythrobacter sp. KTW20L]MCL6250429.1 hypothetical protein [Altererythrobacter sp. KTW20L]
MAGMLPLSASAQVQNPTTVNGQVLGPVENFTTHGPALVCMEGMGVHVRQGETVYLEYLGIHDGRLRKVMSDGSSLSLAHGDAWVDQRGAEDPAFGADGVHYFQIDFSPQYQVFLGNGLAHERQSPRSYSVWQRAKGDRRGCLAGRRHFVQSRGGYRMRPQVLVRLGPGRLDAPRWSGTA